MKILIVQSPYYEGIAEQLLTGAKQALYLTSLERSETSGGEAITYDVVSVPGALEIPAAIKFAFESKHENYDGYVALGCVIRGETKHFDLVAGESARGIMDLTVHYNLAIANAILTVENKKQAEVRADAEGRDLGGSAALTCLEMIDLKRRFF
ncbi:MAG: 6,7-dimethyl-8-ribityllumazine synthase [Alphaproteobacteria bacterium]